MFWRLVWGVYDTCWRTWHVVHVEHKGAYSLERLQVLHHFLDQQSSSTTSTVLNVVVAIVTPLPCLAIALASDGIPLEPPEDGPRANRMFWVRSWLVMGSFTVALLLPMHHPVITPIPERKAWLYIMSAGISAAYTGIHFAVALELGFPVPFSYLTLNMVWISLILGGLWAYMGPTCRASACVRQCLKHHAIFIYAASSLAVVYPLFYYAFLCAREYASAQLLLTFALPVIKMMEKLLLYHATTHASDLQPVFIAFNVEVFNALFVSSCMRHSTSMSVTITLMVADFVGACAAIYGLQNTMLHIDVLNSKLGKATRVQMVEIAALIANRYHPDTLVEAQGTHELQTAVSVTPWVVENHANWDEVSESTSQDGKNGNIRGGDVHVDTVVKSPSSPSKVAWMKKATSFKASAIVPAATNSLSPLPRSPSADGMASRTSSVRIMEQLSVEERQNFAHQTCRLLRRVEFLLLVEYTEVVVPIVYVIYIATVYHLPNRKYFPYLNEMSETDLAHTIRSVMIYGLLQLVSFVLLLVVLSRRFQLAPGAMLRFVLRKEWRLVQSHFVIWIIYVLQSSIEHVESYSQLSLPPPILVAIIQYAVDGLQPDLAPHKRVLPVKRLQELALVWRTPGPEDIEDVLEEIKEYGAPVRDFRLRLGPYEPSLGVHDPRRFHLREPEPGDLDQLNIDWDTMFSYLPGLKRLNLTEVSLLSRHIPRILEAASKSCRSLEILILPSKKDFFGSVKEVVVSRLLMALIPALEKWYLSSGGLRQLTMASCEQGGNVRCSQQYVEAVARFCPRIEYVDGYEQTLNSKKEPCSDMWPISLETWQAFNASSTADVVVAFGEYALGYDYYLRHFPGSVVRVDENVSHPGYGTSAASPGDTLRACPALTKLYIEIDHYANEESQERYVDPFVYGDEFWEAVAQHCPLLEAIEMLDSSDQPLYNMRPIDTMAGRTLVALAGLKWLRQCTIGPARLTGNDIFDYLCRASSTGGFVAEREFNISIGGHESNRLAKFYAAVLAFLKLLSETSEETLGAASCSMKPHLHITNPYNSKVRQSWSEGYMRDELKPVFAAVREKHPSMAIEVSIGGRNGNKFNRIRRLSLTWRSRSHHRTVFRDIDGETAGRDSDSDVSIYSGGGGDDSMSGSEDENMEEN